MHGSIAFAALVGLTGCSVLFPPAEPVTVSYFAAHYKLRAETDPPIEPDVKQSSKFPDVRKKWQEAPQRKAALRAPSYCTERQTENIALVKMCDTLLAEIERVLVDQRYVVVNWSTL